MAVRIIEIAPKVIPVPQDPVLAHLSIQNFKWVNEQTLQAGTSSLVVMFDWIVNKKGQAYIKKNDVVIPVFGAIAPGGKPYLRCIKDRNWSNELLDLPELAEGVG